MVDTLGLCLAQLLRQNGCSHVVVAAPGGSKLSLAKNLGVADEYIELSRENPTAQFEKLKADEPYGFDIVVEATGSSKILNDAIHYVRRGGKLVVYGVYSDSDRVTWPPAKICRLDPPILWSSILTTMHLVGDEITILGSFSETFMFPATIGYLDTGKVKVDGIVNKTFKLEQWGEVLESMKNKSAIKAAVVFD